MSDSVTELHYDFVCKVETTNTDTVLLRLSTH